MGMDKDILRSLWITWGGKAIRALLLALGVWLKATGKPFLPQIVDAILPSALEQVPQFTGDLFVAGTLLWTGIQGWLSHRKLQAQKDAPAGTPIAVAAEVAAAATGK